MGRILSLEKILVRSELEPVLTAARELPAPELPRLLGELEEVRATALARLSAPATAQSADELLNVAEASRRLGTSTAYLYRHAAQFPFTRRMGRKLLFSSAGLSQYIKRKS